MSITPLSDRPTPETDAAAIRHCANWSNRGDYVREIVFADFTRNLERQRDALAEALREILKADEECEAEFAKMGIPAEPEHWTTTKAKAALATLNPKP